MAEKIIVVDDKESLVKILSTSLSDEGYEVDSSTEGLKAIEMLQTENYDLLLCDVNLPDITGMEILKKAKEIESPPSVVMITAFGSIENAIECMKLGADDYVTKPFNIGEIKAIVLKALEKVKLIRENKMLRAEVEIKYDFSGIIGKSKSMQDIFDRIKRVSRVDVTVFISGETGVGKELIAKAIHYNSPRSRNKFVGLNCAAIPDNLLESELFGHVRGAFTGAITSKRGIIEEANGGTLLLDEIAELQPMLQAKLLRALDEGAVRRVGDTKSTPIDARLICSTNKDLKKEVEENRFRLDLYHRIKVVEIVIPPLRERREDIMPLVDFYLAKICKNHNKNITGFSHDAVNLLLSYPWPGNVREIINVLEQASLLTDETIITASHLNTIINPQSASFSQDDFLMEPSLKKMLAHVEKKIIEKILKETGGNRKEVADRLCISERALYYKLDEHGLK